MEKKKLTEGERNDLLLSIEDQPRGIAASLHDISTGIETISIIVSNPDFPVGVRRHIQVHIDSLATQVGALEDLARQTVHTPLEQQPL